MKWLLLALLLAGCMSAAEYNSDREVCFRKNSHYLSIPSGLGQSHFERERDKCMAERAK